jgi:diguanylate cyclase (GGDEF)-like protein
MEGEKKREVENLRKLVGVLRQALIQKDCELQFAMNQMNELEHANDELERARSPEDDFDSFHLYLMDCCESLTQENESLKPKLYLDELTGAYNVRYFLNRIDEELQRALRYKRALSVIVVSIDDFTAIYESFGVDLGNHILKEAFKCIKDTLRGIDIIVRFKDNDFVIILPETSRENAHLVEGRIAAKIEALSFQIAATISSLKIRISTRVNCFDDFSRPARELLQEAIHIVFNGRLGKGAPLPMEEGIPELAQVNN